MKILPQARGNSFSGNALLIFLIRFFPSLASVLVVILFSRQFDEATYGLYQNFWVQLYLLNTIACLGFQAFIVTYSPSFITALLRRLKLPHYIGYLFWVALAAIIFTALRGDSLHIGYAIPFFFFVIYTLSVIAESLLIAYKDYKSLLAINILYTIAFAWLHLMVVSGRFTFEMLFTTLLVAGVVRLLLLGVRVVKCISQSTPGTAEEHLIIKAKKLWMHIGVYDVSQMLFRWIDKFVISLLFAEQLSAIYFNGSIDIPFLPLLLGAAASSALIQMAGNKTSDNDAFAVNLANHSSRLLSAIVFPVFFFLLFYRYELIGVLLSEKYEAAVPIFLMSIMALPLRAYSFTSILQNRHKGAIINTGAVLDLLIACALMYPLYLWLGLPGIALSFAFSSYLQAGYYLYYTSKTLGVAIAALVPFANLFLKFIIFAFLFIAFHYLSAIYFTAQIVLFSGMLLTMLAAAITLLWEYKAAHK